MRDYAKKNRHSSSSGRKGFAVLIFFLMMLAFSFMLGMVFVKHHKIKEAQAKTHETTPQKVAEKPKIPAREYDFYTLLPKLAVPNNDEEVVTK